MRLDPTVMLGVFGSKNRMAIVVVVVVVVLVKLQLAYLLDLPS
jgi:uncharacterized membrane protein